jgi:hypothetical protein
MIHANDLEVGPNGLTTGDIVRCASRFRLVLPESSSRTI